MGFAKLCRFSPSDNIKAKSDERENCAHKRQRQKPNCAKIKHKIKIPLLRDRNKFARIGSQNKKCRYDEYDGDDSQRLF